MFYMVKKRCSVSGLLTLEPRTTDSLSITSTNISLFPPWINACKIWICFSKVTLYKLLKHAIIIRIYAAVIISSETYFVLLCCNTRLLRSFIPALCWTEWAWWLQNLGPLYFVVSQPQTEKKSVLIFHNEQNLNIVRKKALEPF